ncbi:hypothetical protein [Hymenobacter sp. B1770]|uniref:hypothetical protein n=1 Tax=Hymenobacter sp. B1770 TaxID=1718788 RepID=UPI003CE9420F
MKSFHFCFILSLLFATPVLAQPGVPGGNDGLGNTGYSSFELMNKELFDNIASVIRNSPKYNGIMGSLKNVPGRGYFTPDWLPGTMVWKNGVARKTSGLRFNLALQTIEVRDSSADNGIKVLPASELTRFSLGPEAQPNSHFFEVHTYQNSSESGTRSIFEALNTGGEVRFFLMHMIGVVGPPPTKSTAELQKKPTYVKETHLYVLRAGQSKLSEFQLGRKSTLKLFGDRSKEMEAYASSKNLSYENVPDLVWLADYYNKLAPKNK